MELCGYLLGTRVSVAPQSTVWFNCVLSFGKVFPIWVIIFAFFSVETTNFISIQTLIDIACLYCRKPIDRYSNAVNQKRGMELY